MRHALFKRLIDTNPALDLVGLKLPKKINHHPALPTNRLKTLLYKIDTLRPINRLIVLINLHIFIRSSELRYARWNEIDFNNKVWLIPEKREPIEGVVHSHRGGKKRAHIVPLTEKVISYLKELKQLTGSSECISTVRGNKPIAHGHINHQLKLLGYDTRKDVCGHGFRAIACSALVEGGFTKDAVEKQMSHEEENQVRASYTHLAEHIEERRLIMQWWSNYLDYLKEHDYIPPYEFKKITTRRNNVFYLMPHYKKHSNLPLTFYPLSYS